MKKVNCILLVDDNVADNYYNEYIIKHDDICNQIKVVVNGLEAIAYLTKSWEQGQSEFPLPDVLFLDINMPRMDGFEFLDEFKKLDEGLKSKVLVIMLTTSINSDDRRRAKGYIEIKEFHNKPLSVDVIHQIIERHF